MHNEIEVSAEKAIQEEVFPGCIIGVVQEDGKQEVLPFGKFTYDTAAPDVRADAIYDLASITKSIPTASLALMFVAEGKLDLKQRVAKYIPEFQNDYGATVEDLLTYRVRGPQLSTLQYKTFEEIRTHIFEQGFDGPPGESVYTNLPAYVLGVIVERVGDEILPALAHRYFFEPLGMRDTTFFPHDLGRVTPTEIVDGVEVRGLVHDESARVFARARRAVGHAGLFSTAPDILDFLEALLQGKHPPIVDGAQKGLGWQLDQPWFMGKYSHEHTFGKTGFTGMSVVVDIERGVAFVILSNRTYPKRPPDTSAINVFRADIADILLH